MLLGHSIGIRTDGPLSQEARDLYSQKGFIIKGADISNTQYSLVMGPLVHCIPKGLPDGLVDEFYGFTGAKFINVPEERVMAALPRRPDRPVPEYVEEMRRVVEGIDEIASAIVTKADDNDDDGRHTHKIHIGAVLPNGEVLDAHICMHCALAFVTNQEAGEQYHDRDLIRLLMAFVIGVAENEREKAEGRPVDEQRIKTTIAPSTNTKH